MENMTWCLKSILLAAFVFIEMKHGTINCFVFLDCFWNLIYYISYLKYHLHDRFFRPLLHSCHTMGNHISSLELHSPIHCCLVFYLYKDYSFSHCHFLWSKPCGTLSCHCGVWLSVYLSVCIYRHIVVSAVNKE